MAGRRVASKRSGKSARRSSSASSRTTVHSSARLSCGRESRPATANRGKASGGVVELLIATRKGLFQIRRGSGRGASAWRIARTSFLGSNVSIVLRDPRSRTMYAALDHGHFGVKLHRSRDDGKAWQEIAAPRYPEGAMVPANPDGFFKEARPASLKLIWSLEVGGPDVAGELWCGTLPGGLFRSTDFGDTWQLVTSLWDRPERAHWFGGGYDLPGIHSIHVDPRDPTHVTIAISCGGVWTTHDRGGSWNLIGNGMKATYMPPEKAGDPNIQDAHRLAVCNADPEVMWVQHHDTVYRSTDGGRSFTELTGARPSRFGFAVAAHPTDRATAWFVPAIKDEQRIPVKGGVVVSRTRNGGKSFEVLTKGLPQENAYDLTFRHGLDVDCSGERLAFGSTTGSLWVSENSGDSWTEVSSNLPPIYCVRWG